MDSALGTNRQKGILTNFLETTTGTQEIKNIPNFHY